MKSFNIQNRRYLGNKFKLLNSIKYLVKKKCGDYSSFIDLFSGTGVVANSFNSDKVKIITNDLLYSNYVIAKSFFETTKSPVGILKKIESLNSINTDKANYFSKNFGNKYFTRDNAIKIGATREKIEKISTNANEKFILITSLIYAADRIANTVGHYDAYRENLDTRGKLELQVPNIDCSKNKDNKVYCMDSNILANEIKGDVVYIDPPYNSRQYSDTYHLLDNLALWKKPDVFGKAKKMDRSHIKSKYCSKDAVLEFQDLITKLNAKHIIVSYNNTENTKHGRSNAKISFNQIKNILMKKGKTEINQIDFKAFTTGKSKTDNHKEILFYCRVK
jgi:adenine-specific DNA-methyltransferase